MSEDVTKLINTLKQGENNTSPEALLSLIYDELRRLAASKMAGESPTHTLQPTALVHEAWLRVSSLDQLNYRDRNHFFNIAAEAMRRVLIDRARKKIAAKRGAGAEHISTDGIQIETPDPEDRMMAVHDALEILAKTHPDHARLVKLRYFAGLKLSEAANILDISEATAKRWWTYARAWLFTEIKRGN